MHPATRRPRMSQFRHKEWRMPRPCGGGASPPYHPTNSLPANEWTGPSCTTARFTPCGSTTGALPRSGSTTSPRPASTPSGADHISSVRSPTRCPDREGPVADPAPPPRFPAGRSGHPKLIQRGTTVVARVEDREASDGLADGTGGVGDRDHRGLRVAPAKQRRLSSTTNDSTRWTLAPELETRARARFVESAPATRITSAPSPLAPRPSRGTSRGSAPLANGRGVPASDRRPARAPTPRCSAPRRSSGSPLGRPARRSRSPSARNASAEKGRVIEVGFRRRRGRRRR